MTTATEQFDVDRCVNEDGKRCEVRTAPTTKDWREAVYIGTDKCKGGHVFRYTEECAYRFCEPDYIRNIQPKPSLTKCLVWRDESGGFTCLSPIGYTDHRLGSPVRIHLNAEAPPDAITINLDTRKQVEPDVMTADELWDKARLSVERSGDGSVSIYSMADGGTWLWFQDDSGFGDHESPRKFKTELDARIEATRIAREGKHNA